MSNPRTSELSDDNFSTNWKMRTLRNSSRFLCETRMSAAKILHENNAVYTCTVRARELCTGVNG